MKITTNFIKQTKRHFSASGSILLPLALKWGLIVLACALSGMMSQNVSAAKITLTVSPEPLNFSIAPSVDGAFGKSTAGSIKITTDALAGYTLNITSKTSNDLMSSVVGNKITSISNIVSENDFINKTDYNNKWGFAFYKQGRTSNMFYPGPNSDKGTQIGSSEAPNSNEDIYNIILGARIDNTIATGQYSNTFVVSASANPVPYVIIYDDNAEEGVTDMPEGGPQKADTEIFSLSSDEPKRSGYRFLGWCDSNSAPTKTENIDICDADKTYKPGAPYALSSKNENITMYAMWAKEDQVMQNWKGCDDLSLHQVVHMVDLRDNKIYTVSQLKDGLCWMTLNIAIGSNNHDVKLDSVDSDIAEGSFTLYKGKSSGWTNAANTAEMWITEGEQYNKDGGGFYNWFAATAGDGKREMVTGDTQQSVCPKGWRLPTSTEIEAFTRTHYTLQEAKQPPINLVYTGRCCATSWVGVSWWTSTPVANNSAAAYDLYADANTYFRGTGLTKQAGASVRCVSRYSKSE